MSNMLSIKLRQHLGFVFFVLYLVFFVLKNVSLYVFSGGFAPVDVGQKRVVIRIGILHCR